MKNHTSVGLAHARPNYLSYVFHSEQIVSTYTKHILKNDAWICHGTTSNPVYRANSQLISFVTYFLSLLQDWSQVI